MLGVSLREHLEKMLDALPTSFSQLAFLTSVRDFYTGEYLHEGWLSCASREAVHEVLQRTHRDVFELVLDLDLPHLCKEIKAYLESLSVPCERSVRLWLELESYREMIPEAVSSEARALFVSQMRASLGVLSRVPEWPDLKVLSASQCQPLAPQLQHRWEN